MLRIRPPQRQLLGNFLFEQMVPEDHLLRRIAAVVDFSFADELLAPEAMLPWPSASSALLQQAMAGLT